VGGGWGYFERLRKEDPVHFCAERAFGPYWSITRYADIVHMEKNPEIFSSARSITLADPDPDFPLEAGFITMDGPRHDAHRKVVQPVAPPRTTEARADVLAYTSDPLDADLEVIGEVAAEVFVAASQPHFDVFVRLCDVDERGCSTNVCDGIQRVEPGRWKRDADGVQSVRVTLWTTAQRFRRGHRIRVQVASGAHPRFVRNLGSGEPLATGTTLRASEQSIHHAPGRASAILLPMRRP
jgi:putative CocE/NonD family hydrolase